MYDGDDQAEDENSISRQRCTASFMSQSVSSSN